MLVRRLRGRWWLAAIRPGGKPEGTWALPKGNVGSGAHGRSAGKLGDVKYVYTRGGARIFKIVSFYLLRYRRGRIDELPDSFRHEVAEARWLPLEEAPRLLAYRGEKDMAKEALARLEAEAV